MTSQLSIPEGITILPAYFRNRSVIITDIKLPNSLQIIEEGAFSDCDRLKSIKIPDNVEVIERCAFSNCVSLVSVQLSKNIKFIGEWAFSYCSFETITLPEGLTYIGEAAFMYCDKLQKIYMPSSLEEVEPDIFQFCPDNLEVIFNSYPPPSKEIICTEAFYFPGTITLFIKDLAGNSYKITIPGYGTGLDYFEESCLEQVAAQMNEPIEKIEIINYVVLYK